MHLINNIRLHYMFVLFLLKMNFQESVWNQIFTTNMWKQQLAVLNSWPRATFCCSELSREAVNLMSEIYCATGSYEKIMICCVHKSCYKIGHKSVHSALLLWSLWKMMMKVRALWDIALCSLGVDQCFRCFNVSWYSLPWEPEIS
jgi:hypothetical protein